MYVSDVSLGDSEREDQPLIPKYREGMIKGAYYIQHLQSDIYAHSYLCRSLVKVFLLHQLLCTLDVNLIFIIAFCIIYYSHCTSPSHAASVFIFDLFVCVLACLLGL